METETQARGIVPPTPAELVELLQSVDPTSITIDYDRDIDTLLVHFDDPTRRAVSLTYGPVLYVLFDRERGEVVGLHFENFLRHSIATAPEILRHGRSFGFSEDDVAAARGVPRWRRALRLYRAPSPGSKAEGELSGQSALRLLEPLFPSRVQHAH